MAQRPTTSKVSQVLGYLGLAFGIVTIILSTISGSGRTEVLPFMMATGALGLVLVSLMLITRRMRKTK